MSEMLRRVTWHEAERIHPGCGAAWDCTGRVARVVYEQTPAWFCGSRLPAIVPAEKIALNFDPRVGLWVRSYLSSGDDALTEMCSLEWFHQMWWSQASRFDWRWDGKRLRAVGRKEAA